MERGGKKPKATDTRRSWVFIGIVIAAATIAAVLIWWGAAATIRQTVQVEQRQPQEQPKSIAVPRLSHQIVTSGRGNIWEIAFLPSGDMLFTERQGVITILKGGKDAVKLKAVEDVQARGEGGLLGMAVDPKFTDNRFIYTCFNSAPGADIRVVRWQVNAGLTALDARTDIVTGIPANPTGRHSGCRIAFGPDGYLWIGTGDTARGDTSIQPKSLGGKILRIDRNGKAAPGNLGGAYDARIFSYGHRNVQGLAFFPSPRQGILGISVEHGSTTDDEVNLLRAGNFGWAPPAAGYDERVPMTDKARFPEAVEPIWKSGSPTQAPSGAAVLSGAQWKSWNGFIAVAMLKAQHLKILAPGENNKVTGETKLFEGQFGRLRTVVQGPDGDLYLATDNSSNNQIIRVTPQ